MTLTIFTPGHHSGRSGRLTFRPRRPLRPNTMHLPTAQPFDGAAVLDFLAARAITGVEEVRDGTYRRTLALPARPRDPGADAGRATASPRASRSTTSATSPRRSAAPARSSASTPTRRRSRRTSTPTRTSARWSRARPGLRVPGVVDGWEIAARAVLGQQITVAAARTLASRITAAVATPLADARRRADPPLPDPGPGRRRARRDLHDAALARPHAARPRRRRPAARRAARRRGAPSSSGASAPGPRATSRCASATPTSSSTATSRSRRRCGELGADPAAAPPSWSPWRSFAVLHLWASLAGPAGLDPVVSW